MLGVSVAVGEYQGLVCNTRNCREVPGAVREVLRIVDEVPEAVGMYQGP